MTQEASGLEGVADFGALDQEPCGGVATGLEELLGPLSRWEAGGPRGGARPDLIKPQFPQRQWPRPGLPDYGRHVR